MKKTYDVAVVGGGMSGVCAALASARHGAKTALIQDRPVLGGNASSEIRMHICGASREGNRKNARETGIIEEIMLENQARNPQHSFSVCDTILWEKTRYQENLDLFLNTRFLSAKVENSRIRSVIAHQTTTEKDFEFEAKVWIDATGDGMLAERAGAVVMRGREGREEYGESLAPDKPDRYTMGNSIMFTARDMGRPMPFKAPPWAYHYDDADIPGHQNHNHGRVVEATSGYWWLELGGDRLDSLEDGEEIRDELLRTLYGIWEHLKNQDQGCGQLALDWIGFLPGKRESRRIKGEYVLTQNDLTNGRRFEDDIAYGGWHIDIHPVGGFAAFGDFRPKRPEEEQIKMLKQLYGIPYRCLLPINVSNLLMAGRAISVSHIAFGSTRVMATCALVGQAAGTAAAMAAEGGVCPREVDVDALQQTLMQDDCYLPGRAHGRLGDRIARADLSASSHQAGCGIEKVRDGFLRKEEDDDHCWRPMSGDVKPEIRAVWPEKEKIGRIILRFDSNCDRNYMISISKWQQDRIYKGVPEELPKDIRLTLRSGGQTVWEKNINDNYQRFLSLTIPEGAVCDELKVEIMATNGADCVSVFSLEAYER